MRRFPRPALWALVLVPALAAPLSDAQPAPAAVAPALRRTPTAALDVLGYRFARALTDASNRIDAVAKVTMTATAALDEIALDLVGPDPAGKEMAVTDVTEHEDDNAAPAFAVPLDVDVDGVRHRLSVTRLAATFRLPAASLPRAVTFDPDVALLYEAVR